MLCYRCGSHVPDTSETCATCGQKFDAAARQAAGAARKRGAEGAPYKPGDVVADRYAIQEVVGAGPLGFVFRAQDQAIDVEVALKVIQPRLVQQPEERTQFALSMRVGKKLNHPNLVRVYEEGVDGDRPFFTMQLLEGLSLRRMMEQRAAKGQLFSLKEVEPLLAQMAAALDGAHRFGPHSDVKPENVFVLPDMLKVSDYGLGLAVPHLPFVQAQKGHRAAAYIAPEYVNGAELDTRMDVYSLGVLMGELVTGLLPEDGGVPEVSVRHQDLPPAFESLYRRALNVNPLARPKSGGELHAEFAALVQRHPAAASRQRAVPASGALSPSAVAARAANKPLPPVPTGMLPVASAPTPAAPLPAVEDDPPPDATQPLDAATLAAILGSNAKALDYITGPEARSVSDAATMQEMRAVAPSGRKGAEAAQASDAAAQQEARAASRPVDEPRAAPAKAAEPVMRIFAKAEEPSFPADPRGARSAEGAAEARSSARGGGESSGRGEASSGDLRSSGRGEASGDGRSGRGEASSGDLRSNGRGEASSDGRSARADASSSDGRSGRGESSSGDLRSNGRGEAASGDGRSNGRGEAASSDARSNGRGETSSEARSNGRGEAAMSDERSGRGEASSGGRPGRGAEASTDSRPSHRNADASATESRSGRSSDDDEPSESRSSSRGGRNPRASGAVSSVSSRGADPSGPRAPRASAAQGAVRASGVHGENSTGGRSRKGEPPPEVSGVRSSARRLPPSTSGLHTLPTTRATQAKPARSGPSSMVWMIILAVAGVVLGAGGGYLYLRLRQAQAAKNNPTTAAPGAAAAGDGILATGSCPAGMRLVSGGSFKKGSSPEDLQSAGSTDEMPMASVMVESFCVDEYEFPNQLGRKPRVNATWLDAKAACEELGKRLCSEEEWEKACKGPGNARFSSGDEQARSPCNTGTPEANAARTLANSGAFPSCHSAYGVTDLSGNVAEWTSSNVPDSTEMLIKGGSFAMAGDTARCSARRRGAPSLKATDVGFRCCQNAP
ncbi:MULTISPECIES: protein kinase domain-containing protein [unclassified Corallococcus]|uniref:protein kinase domain-containing protein n=1 Tax=unclassified Corallococcus TaxID=2685029 RepID=UPI001A8EA551|nr:MULTISPECIES: SUMF1/EgtB/PvdO family nonheme iron enzyme [unclassified Corallococcus]MBN9683407.1 SUMF1/EgtB/PvdO family nonheme iron enzyme [Corallococcus sp. NCSPR001]WAS85075.1 SUMF1/EgtB/PvdO family nonheme iron enzyme [Corallococcus sp. NCRR]